MRHRQVAQTLFAFVLFVLILSQGTSGAEPADSTSATSTSQIALAVSQDPNSSALYVSACPELTDSVYRLYAAYFGREPDSDGWDYWLRTYEDRSTNLETISASFEVSDEFVQTYGRLDNREFVRLVYRNVMDRDPDPAGWDHWTNALNSGYGRGAVMIAFSESEEYVVKTNTWPPLAGYLTWYSRPKMFACGTSQVRVPTNDMRYADVAVWNDSAEAITFEIDYWPVGSAPGTGPITLQPNEYYFEWNVEHDPRVVLDIEINVPVYNDEVFWTVMRYDSIHSETRHPYDQP